MKILIVDDEAVIAQLLAEAIRLQGHEPLVAARGAQALALLEQELPDAVFLDIAMPEMNGIEVLRRIRERHQSLPVIVITGRGSPEQIEEARRLGITDWIEKPFGLAHLNQALRSLEHRDP